MRNRNMYYATGIPGWMRFGYSPGWGGMPPCAQYFGGQMPQTRPWPVQAPGYAPAEMEAQMLAAQLAAIADQLEFITQRLDALDAEQPES